MGNDHPCSNDHSVPESEIDDVVGSSSNTSPHNCNQTADSKVTEKTGSNSLDGKILYEDVGPPTNASLSNSFQTIGSNLDAYNRQPEYPAEEMKESSLQDNRGSDEAESDIAVSRKCSLTSYRLVKSEIGHRRLNPRAPISGNFCGPCSRYSQSKGLFNSKESLNRESLRTGMPQSRVQWSSPRAPRQERSNGQQRSGSGIFGPRSSGNPAPNVGNPPNVGMFLRFTSPNPFPNNDRFLRGLPGFIFNRGFDNDGFFFFTVNLSPQGPGRQRPSQASKEQIEKAVSQLKGLGSDLEIKKGDTCPICLEQFRTTDNVVEMPCPCKRTFFHRKCAVDTLEITKKIKCPNCRRWDGNNTGK